MPCVGLWVTHLTLIVLVGTWLTLVEYVLDVNFVIAVVVMAALVLLATLITHARIAKLKRYCRDEISATLKRVAKKHGEFRQIITMHSTLRCIFKGLHPEYLNTPLGDYLFGKWLWKAVTEGNILDWLHAYENTAGTRLPRLKGLLDHIDETQREVKEWTLLSEVRITRGHESFLQDTEPTLSSQPEARIPSQRTTSREEVST